MDTASEDRHLRNATLIWAGVLLMLLLGPAAAAMLDSDAGKAGTTAPTPVDAPAEAPILVI